MELFTFTPYASGDGFNLSATIIDGQPWFNAADVCRSLEIKNSRQAVARLRDQEKQTIKVIINDSNRRGIPDEESRGQTTGLLRRGNPNALVINEAGLYRLIFTSTKAAAQRATPSHLRKRPESQEGRQESRRACRIPRGM